MRSRPALVGLAAALLLGLVPPAVAAPPAPPPTGSPTGPTAFRRTLAPGTAGRVTALPPGLRPDARVSALVQLDAAPTGVRGRAGAGGAVARRAVTRVQDAVVPRLEAAGADVGARLGTVLNAVQVRVRVRDLDRLAAVPGVRTVQVARVVHLANARSDQATTADETWDRLGRTGRGQVIGVVDSGLDYTHADFGGPGTRVAYERNDGAVVERGTFPTRKVVGGHDFVGDDYDPGATGPDAVPRPDADPLDCQGHGSHVAGTAAGGGVTAAGRPYTGPYTEAALKKAFRVAPGAAPQATLRAYRVFGCAHGAGDDVVVAAIDRAVRDGVDVLNLSFAASWGTADDLQTQAVRAATAAGVLVVAAVGNDGSRPYLAATPATADSALAVTAVDTESATRGKVARFSSGGPRRLDSAQKPDLAAPGVAVPSALAGSGSGSTRMSGTSMATPQTAGVAALVRQAHPTWTPAQVKAVLVSTASATAVTGYDSRRLGTGLVQARRAAAAKTYASTPTGLDSLAFGMNQLGGAYREKRTFQLTNRSTTSVRYGLRATFSSPVRGAALTFSPSALTLKAGRTATVTATLALSAAEVAALPGASASDRGSLSTLHGVVVATPRTATAAHPVLRTAFLSVPVPLSAVSAPASATAGATGDPAPIRLTNAGSHAGTATVYQALLSDPAGDASGTETADVTDLGVRAEPAPSGDPADRLLVLAVGEARGTSTHGPRTALVALDVDGDGAADFRVFSRDTGYQDRGVPDGTLTSFTVDAENHVVDRWTSSAPANGSTVLLPVLASSLGVTAASPPLGVQLAGFSELGAGQDDVTAVARFQPFRPALGQGPAVTVPAGGTATVPLRLDRTRLAGQTATGWLVVTPDDAAGLEADRVRLQRTPGSAAVVGNGG
ncbi:S8 family serine peptidase [Microlunatus capsulatus]|uniref:Subtilisin family serine protease n=1 Tax=Microlunatus capsulatus TaxID=99117 RepID=A0ABS4Z8V2_9ACTN|nr:S8 family serine peptidase [Microlunatus capsulatus]MBP2417473.1 subtilisin family serine protease [Microlunatus capsulatus]